MNNNNGTGGYLYNRIRYLRNKNAKNSIYSAIEADQPNQSLSEYKISSILFLKTTVVSDKNVEEVQKHLKETLPDRLKMIADGSLDFMEHFPFFFVRPSLVSIFKYILYGFRK